MTPSKQSSLVSASSNRSNPLAAFTATIPTNLPAVRVEIFGRQDELRTLNQLLAGEDARIITLTGFGGAGKTTLSLRAAHDQFENFPGGVFFVDLSSINDPALIPYAIAHTLNIREESPGNVLKAIHGFIGTRAILLILDNFEHVIEGAFMVAGLLDDCQHVKILVTSREALRVRGEHVLPLPPLDRDDAVQLFAQRAKLIAPQFYLSEDTAHVVAEICKRVDGLPLAIELAATRTRLFSPRDLLTRLQTDLETGSPILATLTSAPRDLPERQKTLRNTIVWSYSFLNQAEQRMLRTAAFFRSGCSLESLFSVAGILESDAVELLASLVDKSLVRSDLSMEKSRFFVLDVIREFCLEQAASLGEAPAMHSRYIFYYQRLVRDAYEGLRSASQAGWFKRLDLEYGNILAAMDRAHTFTSGSDEWKAGLDIFTCLTRYWMLNGYFYLATPWIEKARLSIESHQEDVRSSEPAWLKVKAGVYSASGSLAWTLGNFQQAVELHTLSLELSRQSNFDEGVSDALNNIGVNLAAVGRFEEAVASFENGIAICRKIGDRWAEMRQLINAGNVYNRLGQVDESVRTFQNGARIAEETSDAYFIAAFNLNLGLIKINQKRASEALLHLKKSEELLAGLKVDYLLAWLYAARVQAHVQLSEPDAALRSMQLLMDSWRSFTEADFDLQVLFSALYLCAHHKLDETVTQLCGCYMTCYNEHDASHLSDVEIVRAALKRAKMRLGQGAYDTCYAHGAVSKPREMMNVILGAMENIKSRQSAGGNAGTMDMFTAREQDVLLLLVKGKTNEEISKELVVVLKTVEKHVASIFRKLGVKNRTEAAAWAVREGLLNQTEK